MCVMTDLLMAEVINIRLIEVRTDHSMCLSDQVAADIYVSPCTLLPCI